ncbi:conserved hypothetical protein [Planktothrix sp. PCC 11201]|uniref:tetratricopeptide repeat protein n=1 Tax=Planktothrix sp. PCC 11201 TaxID=1729650 RepID=UPI00091023F8|nr:tetratricopeptide repeat protein [Planktothrix sp. PCC 11201]SKB12547.1 conserved hypothetical protein [Planktothrix sp. PCC 11201]
MAQEPLDQVKIAYQAGQFAFERGRYRESVQYLEQASRAVEPNSRLGGEIQMWLVTALEASGLRQDAIALCKQLTRHPNTGTRQQARRLLEVLEAPKLYIDPEGFVKIPDLDHLDVQGDSRSQNNSAATVRSIPKSSVPPVINNLDGVKSQDNQFLEIALIIVLLISGGLVWFGSL